MCEREGEGGKEEGEKGERERENWRKLLSQLCGRTGCLLVNVIKNVDHGPCTLRASVLGSAILL